ncbi:hypothetical protein RJ639_011177 [Escallonia herrerae]|uniref:Uncharacterized protein n=1 Tax=Escallonia herrerae TaxID=1293975 RepID=A0AA88VQM7_9ASTE|nr:hypothetical protein RJ639_011177 [Escallonia herrerae]
MWEEDERGTTAGGGHGWHWPRVMVALDSGGLGRTEGKRKESGKGVVGWKQICHWGVSDGDRGQCGIDFTKNNQMGIDSSRLILMITTSSKAFQRYR